jgi:hypothetical protein
MVLLMNEHIPPQAATPQKEGLQSAIDFTKTLLTLATAAIPFVIQPSFFAGSSWLKFFALTALALFVISAGSGLLVFMAGAVNLADGEYDLENKYVKIPGQINVIAFGLGVLFVAAGVAMKLYNA